MTRMKDVFQRTLDQCMRESSGSLFRECFAGLEERGKGHEAFIVNQVAVKLMDKVRASVEADFEKLCSEKRFAEKLRRLEGIVDQQPYLASAGMRCPPIATKLPATALAERRMRLKAEDNARLRRVLASLETRAREHRAALDEVEGKTRRSKAALEEELGAVEKAFVACNSAAGGEETVETAAA